MATLYGAQATYINGVRTLTAKEFGDKIDLFYLEATDSPEIYSLNVFSESNEEMTLDVTFFAPEGVDVQDYISSTIRNIIHNAFSKASLSLTEKVDVRVEEPVGV